MPQYSDPLILTNLNPHINDILICVKKKQVISPLKCILAERACAIMKAWLLTFEIARDPVRATRGQRSLCLPH